MDQPYVETAGFGFNALGRELFLFTLRNCSGATVSITNYGATVVSAMVPDRHGARADVVLGYDTFASYACGRRYFGGLIGRYANRIAGARFSLGNTDYLLAANDGPNCLHGGTAGFHRVPWEVEIAGEREGVPTLKLRHHSDDGAGGFPGSLDVVAKFTLGDDNCLRLDMIASTDRPTVLSLTSHPYFNLTGAPGSHTIEGHELQIFASAFLPVDRGLVPTGERRSVVGTPFDFRSPKSVGAQIATEDDQIALAHGYDHTFVMDDHAGCMALRAIVADPTTGRTLRISSTEPGLHLYTGNSLDGTDIGKGGVALRARSGLCLEPQRFPDAPNRSDFPSAVLMPDDVYRSSIAYQFGTDA